MSQKISIQLDISILPEQFLIHMDMIDLTRILGILLDNAQEKVIQIPDGTIEFKISANNSGCSYIIRNSITEQTKLHGIHVGNTTKGNGHGQGLLIIKQILE